MQYPSDVAEAREARRDGRDDIVATDKPERAVAEFRRVSVEEVLTADLAA